MLADGKRYHASAVPSEDESAEWYQLSCEQFDAAGLRQYEISNFARHGHASRHNLKYWQRQPYIGFGLDAHSMLSTGESAVRFANTSDMDAYLGSAASSLMPIVRTAGSIEIDRIGREQAFEESLFLGLRMNRGIHFDALRTEFGDAMLQDVMPALVEVRDAGLLEMEADRVRLTPRGRMVSNEVFSRLLIASASN
jgi:oxygen-independent coproporphyrinogen III oxidase